jgi:uncharacterized membrane protein YhaH (DUF805 family)
MKSFPGRISRKNFILGLLQLMIATIVLVILGNIDNSIKNTGLFIVFDLIIILAYLVCIAFMYTLYVYRLHDIGRNGWYALLIFVPIVNLLLFLYLLFKKGNPEINKYGSSNLGQSFWSTYLKNDATAGNNVA